MIRPSVVRRLEGRVRSRADAKFSLRTHDLKELVAYVQHLERQPAAPAWSPHDPLRISADTQEVVDAMAEAGQ